MHYQRQSIFMHQRSQRGLVGKAEKLANEYIPPFLLGLAARSEIPHEIVFCQRLRYDHGIFRRRARSNNDTLPSSGHEAKPSKLPLTIKSESFGIIPQRSNLPLPRSTALRFGAHGEDPGATDSGEVQAADGRHFSSAPNLFSEAERPNHPTSNQDDRLL